VALSVGVDELGDARALLGLVARLRRGDPPPIVVAEPVGKGERDLLAPTPRRRAGHGLATGGGRRGTRTRAGSTGGDRAAQHGGRKRGAAGGEPTMHLHSSLR